MDPELRQQPAAYKGAQDADKHITDDPKSGPANDLAGQPARNQTHKQYHQQALTGHIHFVTSIFRSNAALVRCHLVDQHHHVWWQLFRLGCQCDPQTISYFLRDRSAAGAVHLNVIANSLCGHERLPVGLAADGTEDS
jgi:hypothetical protein